MNFWIDFWTCVLIAALAFFAVLAVVVTIGGAFDIQKLLRSMEAKQAEEERDGDAE